MTRWLLYCAVLVLLALTVVFGAPALDEEEQDGFSSGEESYEDKNAIKKSGKKSRGALGQGFQIRKMDLLTKELQSTGSKIFENLDYKKCTKTDTSGTTSKDDTFYSNTESLYSSISTNSKLEGSLKGAYTLGVSVSAVTNNIVSGNSEVSGLSLNLKAQSMSHALKKTCINNEPLNKKLIEDFEALDKEIEKPWLASSWNKYKIFLEKYGSHIVKDVDAGASIYQYVFAKSSERFSQQDFTVKACISLAGPTQAGEVGVSACSDVSKKDIQESKKKSMVRKLVVRGGTTKTRADLIDNLSKESINKFLQEGDSDPSPIKYTFYPIWEILKARYIGKDHFAKALNLDQYFKGFLSFGCPFIETTNKKAVMQKFELSKDSTPDSPTYKCNLGPEGCHDNSDCHYEHAFWCSCAGQSCIRYKDEKQNSGGTSKKVAYAETARRAFGWQGCKRSWFSCSCKDEKTNWQESWSGDREDALRDVHAMILARRRDHPDSDGLLC